MRFSDEMLMAYADGELDLVARAEIEAAMAKDPAVARAVERHRALAGKIRTAYDGVLEEPVPAELAALVADPEDARVVELAARARSASHCGRPLAVAGLDRDRGFDARSACLSACCFSAARPRRIEETDRGLVARGELEEGSRPSSPRRRAVRVSTSASASAIATAISAAASPTTRGTARGACLSHRRGLEVPRARGGTRVVRRIAPGSFDADGRVAGRGCRDRRRTARRGGGRKAREAGWR